MFMQQKLPNVFRIASIIILCVAIITCGQDSSQEGMLLPPGGVDGGRIGQSNELASIGDACYGSDSFLIGAGVYDVTGPAAELGMMGYAMLGQKTSGIQTRLRSRAYVIASPCNNKRIVFVSADLGMIFQAVKQKVVQKLQARYGLTYSDENVMLSATHTHSGPGGFSHYALYNLTILGFDSQNFNNITEGIFQSIVRAHNNMAEGTIKIATGDLLNTSGNRSPIAYNNNPATERARYAYDTDKLMTVIKMQKRNGTEIGAVAWFAVHSTSMHNDNHMISADNKGYASILFERAKGTNYGLTNTFVAAFAQSNEGDASPNVCGGLNGCGATDSDSMVLSGTKQYNRALQLYNSATEVLTGGIDYRHSYVKMDAVTVDPSWTAGAGYQTTCKAAIGMSFAAGAEDGPSNVPGFHEGMVYDGVSWPQITFVPEDQACHKEKVIFLVTGRMSPYPWTPEVLPVQIATIGGLGLIAVPNESTTMAGRRLRETVMNKLQAKGLKYTVIAGLSNAYSGYVTTREEYAKQHYEGASTQFGPYTLAAYQQEFDRLATAMRDAKSVNPGPTPRDLTCCQSSLITGVVFDDVPLFKSFGTVNSNVASYYYRGNTVSVKFWGGHPKNNLRTQSTFLQVQRWNGSAWVVVANDWDPETKYIWERNGIAYSIVTIQWKIPSNASTGTYRIVHYGNWKSGWTGAISSYSGTSSNFTVY